MALVSYNSTLLEWENIIRVKLKVSNPTLLKSGSLGILTNFLAGIKYDAFQFYSKAFQELNIGLAQDFNSMLYHSSIFGAELKFAIPATLSSSLVIPELRLAQVEEIVYTIPRYTTFSDTNGINFIYESEVKLSITNQGLVGTSWNPKSGIRNLAVTTAPNPNLPNTNVYLIHNAEVKQYVREFRSFITPDYSVGESYEFSIGIENIKNIKEVRAWLNTGRHLTTPELDLLEKMDPDSIIGSFADPSDGIEDASIIDVPIKYYKFGSSVRDLDIFLEINETSLSFETGDGTHGQVIPAGSQLIIEVQQTQGVNGNVPNAEYIINNATVDEKYNGVYTRSPAGITINGLSTTGSYGGENIDTIDQIRENVFDQITSRQSIITENDYERLFSYQGIRPFVDAKFLDARAFVFLFNVIHDNDQVVYSTSINYQEAILSQDPFYPLYTHNGIDLISPFYYKYDGINNIDAYIVDPSISFSLNEVLINPNQIISADYRVDIALTYEFERTQTSMTGKSFIEVIGDIPSDSNYEYQFYCSWLGTGGYIVLNQANGYKFEINNLYTDPYCIIKSKTEDIYVKVFDLGTSATSLFTPTQIAEYRDTGSYHQLIKKQTFYKYFQDIIGTSTGLNSIDLNNGYLDNSITDIISTGTDALSAPANQESYILRVPFIDENWFLGKSSADVFETMDAYFIVPQIEQDVNYNTQLTQAFHNTIDIPSEYYPFIFEDTTMPIIDVPEIPINIQLFVDQDKFIVSPYSTVTDFEIALKIAAIKFMKELEGFEIQYFETDLEKYLYNLFAPIIRNVKVSSPTRFQVNNSSTIYNKIQENLTFKELLDFVPPYFYYDYNNIEVITDM